MKGLVKSYEGLHRKSHGPEEVKANAPAAHAATECRYADCNIEGQQRAADAADKLERRKSVSLDSMAFCLFHSPFHKLVQKAFAWLHFTDHQLAKSATLQPAGNCCNNKADGSQAQPANQLQPAITDVCSHLTDRVLEKELLRSSAAEFEAKVMPSTLTSRQCGNMYTGNPPAMRLTVD